MSRRSLVYFYPRNTVYSLYPFFIIFTPDGPSPPSFCYRRTWSLGSTCQWRPLSEVHPDRSLPTHGYPTRGLGSVPSSTLGPLYPTSLSYRSCLCYLSFYLYEFLFAYVLTSPYFVPASKLTPSLNLLVVFVRFFPVILMLEVLNIRVSV